MVAEVAALLPPRVQLELEGRYAAMLSHEPKNYALATYDGRLILRGVAFRSSRSEPFGEHFLRDAIARLFADDDPVRREVVRLMEAGKAVFPVLVESARLPEAAELPQNLQSLLRIQASSIDNAGWHTTVARLARACSCHSMRSSRCCIAA